MATIVMGWPKQKSAVERARETEESKQAKRDDDQNEMHEHIIMYDFT